MSDKKPPTQVAGVQGFVAFEAKPSEPEPTMDWERLWAHLVDHPPFQMYAAEIEPPAALVSDSKDHARQVIRERGHTRPALFESYCQWHAAKGCWPNETPMGEVKQV